MDAVERPRIPRSPQKAYQPAHAAAFRRAVQGHRLELLYDLMFVQGFRRAEALALLITEYDSARGVLKVSGQVQTVKGVTARKSKTKSESGVRFVPLTLRQQDMMQLHLEQLQTNESGDWGWNGKSTAYCSPPSAARRSSPGT
jgi:hypothetical protein